MNKNDFLDSLANELKKRNIKEKDEIIEEYKEHFLYKEADGYTEEEICERLGNVYELAAQFDLNECSPKTSESTEKKKGSKAKKIFASAGFCFADIFILAFFALLAAWVLIMVGVSIASAALSVSLICNLNPFGVIPEIPYWCGAIIGVATAALSVLSADGAFYFAAFTKQIFRSFFRFQKNTIAKSCGAPVLPSVSVHPYFSAKNNRRIRNIASFSAAIFGAAFVLGFICCTVSAGGFEFWHIWGWFGYKG